MNLISAPDHFDKLKFLAGSFGREVKTISNIVLENPKFPIWTGSLDGKHHCGAGGLAQHTYEVAHLCGNNNYITKARINDKHLFLAALFHDVGKMWDYEPSSSGIIDEKTKWEATPHKRIIHHISRSALEWSKAVDTTGLFKDAHDDILHAILAHHGQREWGSPVAPKTKLAWMLHLCDNLSARINDCDKIDRIK